VVRGVVVRPGPYNRQGQAAELLVDVEAAVEAGSFFVVELESLEPLVDEPLAAGVGVVAAGELDERLSVR
jgi:hypothetical protein